MEGSMSTAILCYRFGFPAKYISSSDSVENHTQLDFSSIQYTCLNSTKEMIAFKVLVAFACIAFVMADQEQKEVVEQQAADSDSGKDLQTAEGTLGAYGGYGGLGYGGLGYGHGLYGAGYGGVGYGHGIGYGAGYGGYGAGYGSNYGHNHGSSGYTSINKVISHGSKSHSNAHALGHGHAHGYGHHGLAY
ncbi:dormancy-associated protein 2-like isoform X2 [Daphnia magna]|uniref:dormancy-associated protein 2-like isoform X2 n=1 Tax=Daphnia magna TaxID=35525 RepID=UPI001E1BBC7B|nr:dormancy-associated protein 2-like isoform X2 [Daphnia magna]